MRDKIDTYKKNLILETAAQHFEQYGYEKTQINAIAKELGIGNSTIYKLFKSKEEMFIEYLKSSCKEALEAFKLEFESVECPEDKIKTFIRGKFRYMEENKSFMRGYFIEAPFLLQKLGSDENDPYYEIYKLLARAFEELAKTRKIITQDYLQLAYTVDYMTDSYLKRWTQTEFDMETKSEEAINAFFNGIYK